MIEAISGLKPFPRKDMRFADLHIHTNQSDGRMSPEQVVDFAVRTGFLSAIAVTDHDQIEPAIQARNYSWSQGYDLEVVIGSEISTLEGHLIGLFLKQNPPKGEHYQRTIAR